jgi:pyruvate kinase
VWAARSGIDFLGLSFVRRADDVRQLKQLLAEHQGHAHVIAKIEKPEALEQLAEIVATADGIMVARGDLGVETDIAEVALAQKRIVGECRRQRKPVIVATQMLDSMQHSRFPTRAEVADVANAILDGADACMLSGETAVGEYPRESVEMMHRIALATEAYCGRELGARSQETGVRSQEERSWQLAVGDSVTSQVANPQSPIPNPQPPVPSPQSRVGKMPALPGGNPITEAVVAAAGGMAERLDARLVLVASRSGATALVLAKQRYRVPTLGVSDSEIALRRMCLYWGVFPLAGAPTGSQKDVLDYAIARGRRSGYLRAGDRLILVGNAGAAASAHNQIVVQEVA